MWPHAGIPPALGQDALPTCYPSHPGRSHRAASQGSELHRAPYAMGDNPTPLLSLAVSLPSRFARTARGQRCKLALLLAHIEFHIQGRHARLDHDATEEPSVTASVSWRGHKGKPEKCEGLSSYIEMPTVRTYQATRASPIQHTHRGGGRESTRERPRGGPAMHKCTRRPRTKKFRGPAHGPSSSPTSHPCAPLRRHTEAQH